ncbi:MAG: cytochrome C biogenesis protein CcdA [Herpetosiphonaceae bacterium]|nr:MAG: cytochrome C biogenesis protein CcdA [Herpetosiphonaceae bacterium]
MQQATSKEHTSIFRIIVAVGMILLVIGALMLLLQPSGQQLPAMPPEASIFALAIPAFLAGVLSFLSPCTLPILPAYFAFTFGAGQNEVGTRTRMRVLVASLAFFAGLATTMVLLGASITAVGQTLGRYRHELARAGGIVIITLGLMSFFGKGFSGPKISARRSATIAGAYLYGLTFALGWTACIGPVLGTILTLLLSQGASLIAGAILSFIYVLGLALPLMLVAVFFGRLGQGTRAWRFLRGRGWEIAIAGRRLFLHSTSMISGLLMIGIGILLMTGQLNYLSQYATTGPAEWGLRLEDAISRFFGLGR